MKSRPVNKLTFLIMSWWEHFKGFIKPLQSQKRKCHPQQGWHFIISKVCVCVLCQCLCLLALIFRNKGSVSLHLRLMLSLSFPLKPCQTWHTKYTHTDTHIHSESLKAIVFHTAGHRVYCQLWSIISLSVLAYVFLCRRALSWGSWFMGRSELPYFLLIDLRWANKTSASTRYPLHSHTRNSQRKDAH